MKPEIAMRRLAAVLIVLGLAAAASAADVAFTKPPTAVRAGDGARIEFAVSAATDVAVYVLDGRGNVVRHLAAGVLGDNAPPPFQAGKLAQSIAWDGKDDAGRQVLSPPKGQPAGDGPFQVRVALGLSMPRDGHAFAEQTGANNLRNVIGLACGPDGDVFVLSERWRRAWWRSTSVHRFGRDGKYKKTIKPFPADLPAERVKAITKLTDAAGRPIPTVYRVLSVCFYPKEDLAQQPAVTGDGNLHLLTFRPAYRPGPEKWLATIDRDGGVPYPEYAGGELPSATSAGNPMLAAASNGQSVFAIGLERLGGDKYRPNAPAVWRIDLPGRKEGKLFFGHAKQAGSGKGQLNDPQGIAADGKGRLLVADHGNNRVLAIDERTGEVVGEIQVKAPTWVGVHRAAGAVYVRSGGDVIKFRGSTDAKEVGRLKLPAVDQRDAGRTSWYFALDDSAGADAPAVLWIGRDRGAPALLRVEESGGKFSQPAQADYYNAVTYWNLAAARDEPLVSSKVGHSTLRILDERTGKWTDRRPTGSAGQTYRFGPNGQIYGIDHWKWGIRRWDRDGNYLPFPATKDDPEYKGRLRNKPSGTTSWERDFCVDRAGNIYTKHRGKVYHGRMTVDVYDADGNFQRTAIWAVSDGALGPRVDNAGNIYMAESILPVGKPYPDFFADKLPELLIDKRGNPADQYTWMYGSIVKFSPAGGAVWFPQVDDRFVYAFDGEAKLPAGLAKVKVDTSQGDHQKIATGELEGAQWMHFGCAFLLDMQPSHNRRCHCTATEFDVDDFGRTFFPDQGRFRVTVLDAAGNVIAHAGRYGQQDAGGDDLQLGWMVGLAASDTHLYVADALSRQVIRAKLAYAAEATCEVK